MSKSRVMVALKEIEHAASLVCLASEMASAMDADVVAVNVVEVAAGLPLDADAEILDQPGKEVLECARRSAAQCHGRRIETRLLRARVAGHALVDEAADQHADLLIAGYNRRRGADILERLLLGSTAEYLTRHTPCRMIIQVLPAAKAAEEQQKSQAAKPAPVPGL